MRVTVYASSSDAVAERYHEAARQFARGLAAHGHALVYGGTAIGVMGTLASSMRQAGGHVTGVIPESMVARGLADDACDELVVTVGMGDRKRQMMERAEAFVALPGGFGTLEELLEVITLRQLGEHARRILLLDLDGFYQPLLAFFDGLIAAGFADPACAGHYRVVPEVSGLLDGLEPAETQRDPGPRPAS